jgi:hypothetical protein
MADVIYFNESKESRAIIDAFVPFAMQSPDEVGILKSPSRSCLEEQELKRIQNVDLHPLGSLIYANLRFAGKEIDIAIAPRCGLQKQLWCRVTYDHTRVRMVGSTPHHPCCNLQLALIIIAINQCVGFRMLKWTSRYLELLFIIKFQNIIIFRTLKCHIGTTPFSLGMAKRIMKRILRLLINIIEFCIVLSAMIQRL